MKVFRTLFAILLACTLCGMAKADPVDFHMVVVDPPSGFNTVPITSLSSPTPIVFSACVPGEIPGTVDPYEGCASFENSTTGPITNLLLEFPDTNALNSQSASCAPDPGVIGSSSVDFFQSASCSLTNGEYILDFTDGSIPVGALFTIAEDGVCADDFPTGSLSSAPEPASIWLLSTGALMLAGFYFKRRHGLGSLGF